MDGGLKTFLRCIERARARGERGSALVLIMASITILMVGGAMAVDLSMTSARAEELQTAADAASLGAANVWLDTGNQGEAVQVVHDLLAQNGVPESDTVEVAITFVDEATVDVELTDLDPPQLLGVFAGGSGAVVRGAAASPSIDLAGCRDCFTRVVPPPFSTVTYKHRGHGMQPIVVGNRIYILNSQGTYMECIDRETSEVCDGFHLLPPGQFGKDQVSKQRLGVQGDAHPSYVETYGSTQPWLQDGKIYHVSWAGGRQVTGRPDGHGQGNIVLACFDTDTDEACADAVNLPEDHGRYANSHSTSDGIYIFTNKHWVHCYVPGTLARCPGFSTPKRTDLEGYMIQDPDYPDWNRNAIFRADPRNGQYMNRILFGHTKSYNDRVYTTVSTNSGQTFLQCFNINAPAASAGGLWSVYTHHPTQNSHSSSVEFAITGGNSAFGTFSQRDLTGDLTYGGYDWQLLADDIEPTGASEISVTIGGRSSGSTTIADAVLVTDGTTFHILDEHEAVSSGWTLEADSDSYDGDHVEASSRTDTATWTISGLAGPSPSATPAGERGAPCTEFTPKEFINGNRKGYPFEDMSVRLAFHRDPSGTPTAICSFGAGRSGRPTVWDFPGDRVECWDLTHGSRDSQAENALHVFADVGIVHGTIGNIFYHERSNRIFRSAGVSASEVHCFDFNTQASCGSRRLTHETKDMKLMDFAFDGDCMYGVGSGVPVFRASGMYYRNHVTSLSVYDLGGGACDNGILNVELDAATCEGTIKYGIINTDHVASVEGRILNENKTVQHLPSSGFDELLNGVVEHTLDPSLGRITIEIQVVPDASGQSAWDRYPPTAVIGCGDRRNNVRLED